MGGGLQWPDCVTVVTANLIYYSCGQPRLTGLSPCSGVLWCYQHSLAAITTHVAWTSMHCGPQHCVNSGRELTLASKICIIDLQGGHLQWHLPIYFVYTPILLTYSCNWGPFWTPPLPHLLWMCNYCTTTRTRKGKSQHLFSSQKVILSPNKNQT